MTAINETTKLIVKVDSGGDISDNGGSSCALPSKNSFHSFRASAESFSDALSESMQRIGVLGSTSIAVNSLTGPAMLCLPDAYQRSGLIPTTGTTIDFNNKFRKVSFIVIDYFWAVLFCFARRHRRQFLCYLSLNLTHKCC